MTKGFIGGNQLIAASYARTSTESNDSVSIDTQLKANRRYAESIGATVQYEFREMFTGTRLDRPELAKLRKLIHSRAIDIIIIYTPDRLARRQYVAGFLLHEDIFPNGIALHWSYAGREIRNTPQDLNMFNVEQNEAENERNKLLERTSRGRKGLLEENVWFFGPVKYGYRKEGRKRSATLHIVEDEAAVVRWIFKEYLNGTPTIDIARKLNATDIKPPYMRTASAWSIHQKWSRSNIYRILRDDVYLGRFRYNQRVLDEEGRNVNKPRSEQEYLYYPHLAILDEATHKAAQQKLNEGQSNSSQFKGEYLLARVITCGHCGNKLYAVQGGRYTRKSDGVTVRVLYYKCYRNLDRENNHEKCVQPSWRVEIVDTKAWPELERFLLDPEYRKETLEASRIDQLDRNVDSIQHIESADRVIARHDAEIMKLTDLYLTDGLTKPQFMKKKRELEERLNAARGIRAEYEESMADVLTDKDIATIDKEMEQLAKALEKLGELDFSKRRQLVEAMGVTAEIVLGEDGHYWLRLYAYGSRFASSRLTDDSSWEDSSPPIPVPPRTSRPGCAS